MTENFPAMHDDDAGLPPPRPQVRVLGRHVPASCVLCADAVLPVMTDQDDSEEMLRMLPSLSRNQAAWPIPSIEAMPFSVLSPGIS